MTEGTGINIYTHGEMMPANAYPELKKFNHLKVSHVHRLVACTQIVIFISDHLYPFLCCTGTLWERMAETED